MLVLEVEGCKKHDANLPGRVGLQFEPGSIVQMNNRPLHGTFVSI